MLTHSPFAGSWFWSPILASIPTIPVCFSPLVTLFFFRLPFNQLNACPRELPGFFCPRWALASRAKISVMSLGTRSPVDLLRDILEVLGAKSPPWSVCLLLQLITGSEISLLSWVRWIPLSLFGLALCVCFSCLSPPGTTMKSAGEVRQQAKRKGRKIV